MVQMCKLNQINAPPVTLFRVLADTWESCSSSFSSRRKRGHRMSSRHPSKWMQEERLREEHERRGRRYYDEGILHVYEMGRVKKITPWTLLLEVNHGDGRVTEKRFDKGYLENRADDSDLKEALRASLKIAREARESKRNQHIVHPSVPDAKQCFICGQHYVAILLRVKEDESILAEICELCHKQLKGKISVCNGEARKHRGHTGLKDFEWLKKLQASQGCYCNEYIGYASLIIEHIYPLSWGGDNTIANVVPACISCNSSKGDRDYKTWQRHLESHHLLELLQKHLGLSKFEPINFAMHEGLLKEQGEEVEG